MTEAPALSPADAAAAATAKLDEMTAAYKAAQPSDPRAALKERYADPVWRARLEGGNAEVRREFDSLAAAPADVEQRDAVAVLDHLVGSGLTPAPNTVGRELLEYINGERATTPALRAELEAKLESWRRDPEFQRKLFSGDPDAGKLLAIAMAMKVAAVKGAA